VRRPTIASSCASASTWGEIIVEDGDIFGDGVNVAARLEALAEPGRQLRRGCRRTPRVSSPSSSKSAASSGLVRTLEGQPDLVIVCRDLAAPEPGRTDGRTLFALGKAHFVTHRFDDAAAQLLLAIQDNPGAPGAYGFLAECYAHMGRSTEHARSSRGCAPLPLKFGREIRRSAIPRTASSSCRVCVWRQRGATSQTRRLAAAVSFGFK